MIKFQCYDTDHFAIIHRYDQLHIVRYSNLEIIEEIMSLSYVHG